MTIRIVVTAFLLATSAVTDFAQISPAGPSFEVDENTGYLAGRPNVAADANGNFVVVWSSNLLKTPASTTDVFARRFDAWGTPLGDPFVVNTYTPGTHAGTAVAFEPNGEFIVVWHGTFGAFSDGVKARVFDGAGSPVTGEIVVDAYANNQNQAARIGVDGSGNFVVVWQDRYPGPYHFNLNGRAFDSTGSALGASFQVSSSTLADEYQPRIGMSASGAFVVAWTARTSASAATVRAKRFSSTGAPVGGEFVVSDPNAPESRDPSISMQDDGEFVVAWTDSRSPGSSDVFARRFDSTGAASGDPFVVNSYATYAQRRPAIATDPSGGFVIAWDGAVPAKSLDGVGARPFRKRGTPAGDQFAIDDIADPSIDTDVSIDPNGGMVVVWQRDAPGTGIFARIFTGAGACISGDPDLDGVCDDFDNCPGVYNPAQADIDGDGAGDGCDNCVTIYNPGQENSDQQPEGDACDLTVTFPLVQGDVSCAGAPPTITWSPETYTGFKVFLGADAAFKVRITSGTRWIKVPGYPVPAAKWTKLCGKLGTDLFIKVQGKSVKPKATEFTETVDIPVP